MLVCVVVMPRSVEGAYAKKWALIICATEDIRSEAYLMHGVLVLFYDFDGIIFIDNVTREHVDNAFQWLAQQSGYDDLVFIWFGGHGGGFSTYTDGAWIERNSIVGGRAFVTWDDQRGWLGISNEGTEVRESEIFNGTGYGLDVNNDGDTRDWVGVDEGIELDGSGEMFWDDDFRDAVANIRFRAMVITVVSCFSGGFIDDLSTVAYSCYQDPVLDPILTSSNETWPTWRDPSWNGSYWGKGFINALWPEYPRFDEVDLDDNGAISIYEAYYWAWKSDIMRVWGLESPWLDDDGNREPTYLMEADFPDLDDGNHSTQIYLHHEPV